MRSHAHSFAVLSALLLACGSPAPEDAGSVDAGALDAAAPTECARASDCDDGLFCNGEETCAAEPAVCAPGQPPCGTEVCDEAARSCPSTDCTVADRDGDGRASIPCGGDDCDDDDPARYPGATEVCDADGVDEDCNPDTLGGVDEDGDGFVASRCCNGSTCGTDCDDAAIATNPLAADVCDGVDNDCSGAVDEGSSALCPGGVCSVGACRFRAWDYTFGDSSFDSAVDVAIDDAGNAFVVGRASGGATLLGDTFVSGPYVLALEPDGSLRWLWQPVQSGGMRPAHVTVAAGQVFASFDLGGAERTFDVGGGPVTTRDRTILVSLDAATGDHEWSGRVDAEPTGSLSAQGDTLVVGVSLSGSVRFAGRDVETDAAQSALMLCFAADGTERWATLLDPPVDPGQYNSRLFGAAVRDGSVAAMLTFGRNQPYENGFEVVRLDQATGAIAGSVRFMGEVDNTANTPQLAVGSDGAVFVTMFQIEELTGAGVTLSQDSSRGLLLALDPDLTYRWHRGLRSSDGPSAIRDVSAARDTDEVSIVARHGGLFNAGEGLRGTPGENTLRVIRYGLDGSLRQDDAIRIGGSLSTVHALDVGPGLSTMVVGEFEGTIDLGSGPKLSAGNSDSFLVRIGE